MAKKMMKMEEMECSSCGTCGMHLCSKCAIPNVIFGLLIIAAGLNMFVTWANWINGWTLIGLYLLGWGMCSMMHKN